MNALRRMIREWLQGREYRSAVKRRLSLGIGSGCGNIVNPPLDVFGGRSHGVALSDNHKWQRHYNSNHKDARGYEHVAPPLMFRASPAPPES
jgi:hypothetical protein